MKNYINAMKLEMRKVCFSELIEVIGKKYEIKKIFRQIKETEMDK